ncbi:putative GABA permease [Dactylonectria macrodidyma]|uniref:GABA permease n=1 Tax=Dactylonectria macrodidyma TaxID=307937 RepID=A0A9P9EST3_9HYPO|nr:putative GABA permease [Dactylonectria macrodidyma]
MTSRSSSPDRLSAPKFRKKFNFWTALGIAICSSGSWEGWVTSLAQGMTGGGSVGLLWGWIFVSAGILMLAASLAEYASMWPSSGGQYVWAGNLSPKKYARITSWYTAWFSIVGLWLGSLSAGMSVAVQAQAYAAVASDYTPVTWHNFLINLGVLASWLVMYVYSDRLLHWMNQIILGIHFVGYVLVIGILTGTTKNKHDAEYVFTNFQNLTGWDSDFVSWSVSLLSSLYAFFSLDTACHYAEELENASVVVPRAMILQALCSAVTTFPLIIAVLFCIGDAASVLASRIGIMSPLTQITINSTGNIGVSVFLSALVTCTGFVAGFDLWGAAARSLWSLARDGALPEFLGRLHPRWNVPINANLVLVPPSLIIYMIYIWNTTAFYGIMAGVLVAFQLSYLIPVGLDLFYARQHLGLVRGAFNMGRWGRTINTASFLFACYMIIFMSFPVYYPVTAANMNYSPLIIGSVIIFSSLGWFFYGSTRYLEPRDV